MPRPLSGPLDLRDASPELRARFWSKVAISSPTDCWEWEGYRKPTGYGQFMLRKGVHQVASRVALALSGVVFAAGDVACHRCDNPPCVNPAHLFAGTQLDNALDCIQKGRGNRASGANHPSARLTPDDIAVIRSEPAKHGSTARMARHYGVSETAIRRIRTWKTWRDVA